MGIIRIIEVEYFEDDIVDGDLPMEAYDNAGIRVVEDLTVEEAVETVKSAGLTFAATGTDWAADPDGSYIADYATGRRIETSAHMRGWTDSERAAIIEAVG